MPGPYCAVHFSCDSDGKPARADMESAPTVPKGERTATAVFRGRAMLAPTGQDSTPSYHTKKAPPALPGKRCLFIKLSD